MAIEREDPGLQGNFYFCRAIKALEFKPTRIIKEINWTTTVLQNSSVLSLGMLCLIVTSVLQTSSIRSDLRRGCLPAFGVSSPLDDRLVTDVVLQFYTALWKVWLYVKDKRRGVYTVLKFSSWLMYTIPTCPDRVRTLMQRGHGNQRSAWLYFALPSEQAVNLCLAPAYLGACPPYPCTGRKASHASASSPPPPPPSCRLPFNSSSWLTGGESRLNYSLPSISFKFAFICTAPSRLFCCVRLWSGSRSESVSACCFVSYQLWCRPATVVHQNYRGLIVWACARMLMFLQGSCTFDSGILLLCGHQFLSWW